MTILQLASTLTERFQTTIPAPVRDVLHLGKHAKVGYRITEAGAVELFNAGLEEADPALIPFLSLLDEQFKRSPKSITPYTQEESLDDLALARGVKLD